MGTDYAGPYNAVTNGSQQTRVVALALSSLPGGPLTLGQVMEVDVGLGLGTFNYLQQGTNTLLGGTGVMSGVASWALQGLPGPATIVAVALVGGINQDQLVTVAPLPGPVPVVPGPGQVEIALVLVGCDGTED